MSEDTRNKNSNALESGEVAVKMTAEGVDDMLIKHTNFEAPSTKSSLFFSIFHLFSTSYVKIFPRVV